MFIVLKFMNVHKATQGWRKQRIESEILGIRGRNQFNRDPFSVLRDHVIRPRQHVQRGT
jgi:hypothetical protein